MPGRWVRALFSNDSPFMEPFQPEQFCSLLSCEESGSKTTLTGAPRATDTMNEVFGYVRKVIIDDVCDVRHSECGGLPYP